MLKREHLNPGDIVVSLLHPKIGKVLGFHQKDSISLVQIVGVMGNVSDVPLRHLRQATHEEIAEYQRRIGG